jgi:hypothetical protein
MISAVVHPGGVKFVVNPSSKTALLGTYDAVRKLLRLEQQYVLTNGHGRGDRDVVLQAVLRHMESLGHMPEDGTKDILASSCGGTYRDGQVWYKCKCGMWVCVGRDTVWTPERVRRCRLNAQAGVGGQ